MAKLFIGSLSWNTDNEALRAAFSPYGEVTDTFVVRDRESGRSRGFGFVTFAEDDCAKSAIEAMNDSELDGRTIKVESASGRPNNDRPPRDNYRSGGGYERRNYNRGDRSYSGRSNRGERGERGFNNRSERGNRSYGNRNERSYNGQRSYGGGRSYGGQSSSGFVDAPHEEL